MTSFTVATFNLHLSLDRWLQRRGLVVSELLDLQADVIALQEIALPIQQGYWLRNQLNARMGGAPYQLVQQRRRSLLNWYEGVGLLSRLPIVSADSCPLIFARIAVRIAVDLPSGDTVDVISTHLHSQPHAHETRERQIMRMMGWLDSPGGAQRRVVAGCLRADPDSLVIDRMKNFFGYQSAYAAANGHEPLATFPTALRQHNTPIGLTHDYIFASPHLRVLDARLFGRKSAEHDPSRYPSDHVGIITTLTL
jgi:endonuclease/exonuclease/phosphatase family metal-dependent hydrolase